MDAVKGVFGVTFLALAIWMLSRVLDAVWIMLLSGVLASGLSAALYKTEDLFGKLRLGVGGGVGANALVGGSDRSFALQPLSIQVQTGLDLAAQRAKE